MLVAVILFLSLLSYFYTGLGGPRLLATRLLPPAIILWALRSYLDGGPYPWYSRFGARAGRRVNQGFTTFYITLALIVLVCYALWGSHLALGSFFWHPGASLERILTSSTVEFATGVFGNYTQMALTLIAAFLLLAAVARGFGGQDAIMRTMQRLVGQRRRTVPLTTVLASVSVGMVTGSAAANAAVTGSFTVPLMKRHGLKGKQAGAVETSASMGGLILPPLM